MNQNDGKVVIADLASKRKQLQHQPQPRSILEEDIYVDTLTHIVTRDYYPSLPSLRRDNAILEARSRGDIAAAVTIRRQFRKDEEKRERERQENLQLEAEAVEGMTALTHYNDNVQSNNIRKRPRPLKHETVTGFHERVTSEDNAEFESNQERERKKFEENLGIVYSTSANKAGRLKIETSLNKQDSDDTSNEVYNRGSLLSDNLGLASDAFNATPSGIQLAKGKPEEDSHGPIRRNGLFFEPRHQKLDETTFNSDNLLMPPPPKRNLKPTSSILPFYQSKEQPLAHQDSTAQSSSTIECHKLVEYKPKSSEPNINPPATRFPYQNESRLLPKNSNNHNYIDTIRRSNSHMSDTSASESTDLDSSPRSLQRERKAYQKAKVRENETFVPMTPLIRPVGDSGRIRDEFSSNEERTKSSDLKNASSVGLEDSMRQPTFQVVDTSRREKMARKAEKALMDRSKTYRSGGNKSKRESVAGAPKIKSDPLDMSASLTPAGRALLQASSKRNPSSSSMNSSRKNGVRAKDSFGSVLRTAYTPKPNKRGKQEDSIRRNSCTPAMLRAALGFTPRIKKSEEM